MPSPFKNATFINPEDVKLLKEYLNERCLEPADFPDGLVPFSSSILLEQRGYRYALAAGRPYIMLRYLDPHGNPYFKNKDDPDPYELVRFLGTPTLWHGKEPPPKVIAPDGRPNVLHFEPIRPLTDGEPRSWYNLPDGQIVIHVESMIKAKSVHRWLNLPCIGLNGVWSFASSKKGMELLHAKYDVDFSRFCNVILFDSNTWKPEVAQARDTLAFRLRHILGVKDVRLANLPKAVSGLDWGPDDYLREHGNKELRRIVDEAEEYQGEEHEDLLSRMLDKAVFCTRGGSTLDRADKVVRSTNKARDFYQSINKKIMKGKTVTTVYGHMIWMDSNKKITVLNPAYEYMGEEFIQREDGVYYNGYVPGGIWPNGSGRTGAANRVISQLANMCIPSDLELLRSYIRYLKYSNGKPTSFPVLFSSKRGVGKGWFSKIAYRLLGATNTSSIDANVFVSSFNKQLENKRLVILNEFMISSSHSSSKVAAMNAIKRFLGDEFIIIEPKGMDSYPVENRAGMIITCNALEDVPTDGFEDRRMWYIECSNELTVTEEDWSELHRIIDIDEVMEDFSIWVREGEHIDFATWRPPMNERRQRAIMASSNSMEAAAFIVLKDLQESEEKFICVDYQTIVLLMSKEGIPDMDKKAAKTVTTVMKKAGWIKDERRKYGANPNTQRWAWIIDGDKMRRLSGPEVTKEMERAAKWAISVSKF